jgi:aminotransferase
MPRSYYDHINADYTRRRNRLLPVLKQAGFKCFDPDGAYYVMTDISAFGFENDVEFARFLVKDIGVAVVPGSSFYHDPELGRAQVRFTFCKKDETLAAAEERLQKLRSLSR